MLNLSKENKVSLNENEYSSFLIVLLPNLVRIFSFIVGILFLICLIFMFLPWTQNIRANGTLTTIEPDKRPQTINSIIGGKIEKWYVKEGDFVEKGDTILFKLCSNFKVRFFDKAIYWFSNCLTFSL